MTAAATAPVGLPLIIAGTGHRPSKLGGYSDQAFDRLVSVAIGALLELKPAQVISGMALGWDQALAQAACTLQIPFWAAVPFKGQESAWPERSQGQFRSLLAQAQGVTYVCEGSYAAWKMQERNEWMTDHANCILAIWDGSPGGTKNCVDDAVRRQGFSMRETGDPTTYKKIINVYKKWRG